MCIRDSSRCAPSAKGYRVYVFDRRKDMPAGYTVRRMAEDTLAVMRSLGIFRADLFGASQGGMIALAMAALQPLIFLNEMPP